MKKSLSSFGYKILSIICSISALFLTYALLFLTDEFVLLGFIFSLFVTIFCLIAVYLSFNHSIKHNGKFLYISHFKTVKISIHDLEKIEINDESLNYPNVIFIKTKYQVYRINGYISIVKKHLNIEKTKRLVNELSKLLSKVEIT